MAERFIHRFILYEAVSLRNLSGLFFKTTQRVQMTSTLNFLLHHTIEMHFQNCKAHHTKSPSLICYFPSLHVAALCGQDATKRHSNLVFEQSFWTTSHPFFFLLYGSEKCETGCRLAGSLVKKGKGFEKGPSVHMQLIHCWFPFYRKLRVCEHMYVSPFLVQTRWNHNS